MKSMPRTAIVTGGGRGIGAAIAVALARTGVQVVVTARSARELQRTARARAVRDGTTLRWVLLQALRDYATGRWTPRRGAE